MTQEVSLYSKYVVELKPNGSRWRGLCPFHSEDTPSFFVYEDFGYYCFGCDAHGTFKDFLVHFEEEEHFVLAGLDSIKNGEILNLEELEGDLFEELYKHVRSVSYENKKNAWELFDSIWVDLKFLESSNSLEKLLFVREHFKQIVNGVQNEIKSC